MSEVNLPLYYRESFFSKDSLLHPELSAGRYGVAGEPVPYTVRGDNAVTLMLLACFVLSMVSFSGTRQVFFRQVKNFFYVSLSERSYMNETWAELSFQIVLVFQTCLLLAITYFFYTTSYVTETFLLDEPYQIIGIFTGVIAVYFTLKDFFYTIVNNVFFDSKKNRQWLKSILFISALEGVALFPCVMLQIYFDLSMQSVVYYFVFICILTKLLTFYKCWTIFFRRNSVFLQIILYFCALEIIPLLALWGILGVIVNELKVIF